MPHFTDHRLVWAENRPCDTCANFGGWPGQPGSAAWCLHGKTVHAHAEIGCGFWRAQPDDWVPPPDPGPAPGQVVNAKVRMTTPRIR